MTARHPVCFEIDIKLSVEAVTRWHQAMPSNHRLTEDEPEFHELIAVKLGDFDLTPYLTDGELEDIQAQINTTSKADFGGDDEDY